AFPESFISKVILCLSFLTLSRMESLGLHSWECMIRLEQTSSTAKIIWFFFISDNAISASKSVKNRRSSDNLLFSQCNFNSTLIKQFKRLNFIIFYLQKLVQAQNMKYVFYLIVQAENDKLHPFFLNILQIGHEHPQSCG